MSMPNTVFTYISPNSVESYLFDYITNGIAFNSILNNQAIRQLNESAKDKDELIDLIAERIKFALNNQKLDDNRFWDGLIERLLDGVMYVNLAKELIDYLKLDTIKNT